MENVKYWLSKLGLGPDAPFTTANGSSYLWLMSP